MPRPLLPATRPWARRSSRNARLVIRSSPLTGPRFRKGGRTGPNLYGIIGKPVAADPDFAYGASISALGASGAVWDAASLATYVTDPAAYLKAVLGDDGAKSKMSFKLTSGAEDVAAYLAAVAQ